LAIPDRQAFDIKVTQVDKRQNLDLLASPATVANSNLVCPHCRQKTPIAIIRGDGRKEGLRLWEKSDFVPRSNDIFQERLYCIRWIETYVDDKGKTQTRRYFLSPDESDLEREENVIQLLQERFENWQENGYIPSRLIEAGDKTDEPIRTRGWTYWHHLFTPRQLLVIGLCFSELLKKQSITARVACLLMIGRFAERNSKLCGVDSSRDGIRNTFANQALNANIQYGVQGASGLSDYCLEVQDNSLSPSEVFAIDARTCTATLDAWITDPPYADAINYHELSEFFLAWYDKSLIKLFPNWYSDSKRVLAITGRAEDFRKSMVECYSNLAHHMPPNGAQVVMFTHQDAGVWADLALILWASGLRVTAAWCIATETSSALKEGNYVQGTVLLILRKQTSTATAFLDEIYPKVEQEVKRQLDSMLHLEDEEDPNFGDTDYQLAAYAAALRVLTQYQTIEDIDIAYELAKPRSKSLAPSGRGTRGSDKSEIEKIIDQAVVIACDYLVPKGFDTFVWKNLTPSERFYLKGLDLESHGEYRTGAYQELARGFGIKDYKPFLHSGKANQTRLKTATEFTTKTLGDPDDPTLGFSASIVRNALFAIRETARTEAIHQGKSWLRTELRDYWNQRKTLIEILRYLATMRFKMPHWEQDAKAAAILAGALENDSV
jgi:putative DNA methylase